MVRVQIKDPPTREERLKIQQIPQGYICCNIHGHPKGSGYKDSYSISGRNIPVPKPPTEEYDAEGRHVAMLCFSNRGFSWNV